MTDTFLFFGFAAAYVVLLVWAVTLARRHGWATPASLPLLVVAGLLYDNTVIASGRFVGEGTVLEALNVARYWLHAFLTPLLVVFAWARRRPRGRRPGAPVAATLVVAGVLVWRRQGWVWLLVGSVVMVGGSAVPIPVDSGAVTNAFELALLTSVVATRQHQDRVGVRPPGLTRRGGLTSG